MSYPQYKDIEKPLLQYIYQNDGNVQASECYRPIGALFELMIEWESMHAAMIVIRRRSVLRPLLCQKSMINGLNSLGVSDARTL